jgi:hypothetical protein
MDMGINEPVWPIANYIRQGPSLKCVLGAKSSLRAKSFLLIHRLDIGEKEG